MSFRYFTAALIAMPLASAPLLAQPASTMATPSAATFVKKAGASDKFEIESGKVMQTSSNAQVAGFARKMISAHTQTTAMVKEAAQQTGMTVSPPMLDAMQTANLAKLRAAPKGAVREKLYVKQQLMAHQQALALMQSFASGGQPAPLQQAASQIVPIVQGHIDMLNQMPASLQPQG